MKCLLCAYQTMFNPDVVVYSNDQRKAGLCWGHYQDYKASKPCGICKVRVAVAGVYCQSCLDRETENMDSDDLF